MSVSFSSTCRLRKTRWDRHAEGLWRSYRHVTQWWKMGFVLVTEFMKDLHSWLLITMKVSLSYTLQSLHSCRTHSAFSGSLDRGFECWAFPFLWVPQPRYDWRSISQSVRLGVEPSVGLETRYYLLSGLCEASSLTRGRVYLLSATVNSQLVKAEVELQPMISRPVSWCRAHIWNPGPDFSFLSHNCGFLDVEHPLWREDGSVIYLYNYMGLTRPVTLGSKCRRTRTIFYCLISDSPNLEGQVPVFISPLGSLFVASYCSQGYSGDVLTRLHAGHSQRVEVKVILRLMVSRYVLVSGTLVGLATRYYLLKFAVLFLWGALSDERTCLQPAA
jgi:hypothetical protein